MSLKVKVDTKQVEFNGVLYNIPKLSLKYYNEIENKENNDIKKSLDIIIKQVKENTTSYEYKYILLQISAYNGLMKQSITIKDKEYHIENVYHLKPRDFSINGERVIFEDKLILTSQSQYDVLTDLCVSHDVDNLPAYCLDWADELLNDLAIDLGDTTIVGFNKIQELFE